MNVADRASPPLSRGIRGLCLLAGWVSLLLAGLVVASWGLSPRGSTLRSVPIFVVVGYVLTSAAFFTFAFERARPMRILGFLILIFGLMTSCLGLLNFLPMTISLPFHMLMKSDAPAALGFVRLTCGISSILI